MGKRGADEMAVAADRTIPEDIRSYLESWAHRCEQAVERYRSEDWTTYARSLDRTTMRNFGIGSEAAATCMGCRRVLPASIMTGDHITPKSDKDGLRRTLTSMDRIPLPQYIKVLSVPLAQHRRDPHYRLLLAVRQYDGSLDKDCRNIQPMCGPCNSRKGNREGVDLYPAGAQLSRRSHESPV